MEKLLENVLGISALCGVIFILAGWVVYVFPPKKINYLYGYRTSASMKSQERWDFSQRYSAVQMIRIGFIMVSLSFVGKVLPNTEITQLVGGLAITILGAVYIMLSTERELKKRFKES
jgi:uncharacterized membrane protein